MRKNCISKFTTIDVNFILECDITSVIFQNMNHVIIYLGSLKNYE